MKFELTRSYYGNGEYNQKLDEEDKSYVPDSVDVEVILGETGETVYSSD